MILDCRAGKIDQIITKSISRFARNTLDCLNYVRDLKRLGIGVTFEKEAIDILDEKGEMPLTAYRPLCRMKAGIFQRTAHGISLSGLKSDSIK